MGNIGFGWTGFTIKGAVSGTYMYINMYVYGLYCETDLSGLPCLLRYILHDYKTPDVIGFGEILNSSMVDAHPSAADVCNIPCVFRVRLVFSPLLRSTEAEK